jgi:hypothetical protein
VTVTGSGNLLGELQEGALDSTADLPGLLRKCVALGGETGSARLREWATKELKGYGGDDHLPPYRLTRSFLYLDGATMTTRVSGQQLPLTMIPAFAREKLQGDIQVVQPIAELLNIVGSARHKGEDVVRLAPPGAQELVALINHELAKQDGSSVSSIGLPPSQVVERVYWMVGLSEFAAIIDNVRTTLVELVAEMRAGSPPGTALPTHDVTEQAVDIAVYGKRNRIVVNQVAPHGAGAAATGGGVSTGDSRPESKPRRLMWWIAGVAGVLAAAAGIAALVVH